MATSTPEPWPYCLPIFRRSHRAVSPDGLVVAEIDQAREVAMSSPTIGTLSLSTGLQLEGCNPSFLWSDDSRHLAVPRYFHRFGLVRRQRIAVLDVVSRKVLLSRESAWHFQPASFENGVLTVIRDPIRSARQVSWHLPHDSARFEILDVRWPPAENIAPLGSRD